MKNIYFNFLIFFLVCDNTVCATCANGNRSCTLGCKVGCVTCGIDGNCLGGVCKVGYFNNSGNCFKCDKICKKCSGTGNNCTECADATRNLSENCKCNIGFYSSIFHESCHLSCSFKCNECSEVSGNCISCSDSNR